MLQKMAAQKKIRMQDPISPSLAQYVKGAAHNIARRRHCPEAVEDVEQDLILALLELYAEDPGLFGTLSHKDLIKQAANEVDWQYRRAQEHAARIAIADRPIDRTDPNSPTYIDLAGEDPWPAADLSFAIRQVLATLSPRDQRIAQGLVAGYSAREIAHTVGCTVRNVYSRMRGPLARALMPAL
jgi:RNA polymerase sigma factor (sigma-70 family)